MCPQQTMVQVMLLVVLVVLEELFFLGPQTACSGFPPDDAIE